MLDFDVRQMRPHAPGYILYVAAAKFLDLFFRDARTSLVGVSIISSALAVIVLYHLGLKMFGRATAIMGATLFLSSPLFWFNGEMAFTYALEAFLAVLFGYSCYRALENKHAWLYLSAVFLGLISRILAGFMLNSFLLGLVPMMYCSGRFFRPQQLVADFRIQFILLWVLPAFFFFIGVNLFNPGHVLIILPPLFLYLAEAAKGLAGDVEGVISDSLKEHQAGRSSWLHGLLPHRPVLLCLFILLVFTNNIFFFRADTPVSYYAIKEGDSNLSSFVQLTKENFRSDKALILACRLNTQAAYYLPQYLVYCPFPLIFPEEQIPLKSQNVYISYGQRTEPKTYWIATGFEIAPLRIPDGIDTLILWEEEIAAYYQNSQRPLREIHSAAKRSRVYYLHVNPGERIYYKYHYFSVG
jgi:hypothetical protein